MKRENELIVKSNRLIEASYHLSLTEQRLILMAITEARLNGKGCNAEDYLSIRASDFAEVFDLSLQNAYQSLQDAVNTLFQRFVVLHDIDVETGKPQKLNIRWVSGVAYVEGAATVKIRFSPDILPLITRLESEFTSYKLLSVSKMTSAYAIRLYELLLQWKNMGTREVEIDWLKKTLEVEGEYDRLANFKQWVINVAVSQINEHSDLNVSYEQRKQGRTVTHLIFIFSPKAQLPVTPKAVTKTQELKPESPAKPKLDQATTSHLLKSALKAK